MTAEIFLQDKLGLSKGSYADDFKGQDIIDTMNEYASHIRDEQIELCATTIKGSDKSSEWMRNRIRNAPKAEIK